jgi:rhodanese-related sulfurtransferase
MGGREGERAGYGLKTNKERTVPQKITVSAMQMVAEADAAVETLSVSEARNLLGRDDVTFIDIRDIREVARTGTIKGAHHTPRGMLEFWIDPESPYHKPVFAVDHKFVFYCAGGWRSALAAKMAQDMGLQPVAHIEGGMKAWLAAENPIDPPKERAAKK